MSPEPHEAPAPTGWAEVLDRLDAELDEVETALRSGRTPETATWYPPTAIGPVPEAMRDRAVDVARRLAATQERVRGQLVALTEDLRAVDVRRRAGAAYTTDLPPTA